MATQSPKYRAAAMGTARMLITEAAAIDQHRTPDLSAAPYAWLASVSRAEETPSRKYLQHGAQQGYRLVHI